jgi:hypothetical protein
LHKSIEISVAGQQQQHSMGQVVTFLAPNLSSLQVSGRSQGFAIDRMVLSHTVRSSDGDYDGISVEDIPVSITDNDNPPMGPPAVLIT